jgi:hypothetical protein
MADAVLLTSFVTLFHFTGNVPRSFADATFDRMETRRLVEAAERKYVPKELKIWGGNFAVIASAVYEQKIVYRLEF